MMKNKMVIGEILLNDEGFELSLNIPYENDEIRKQLSDAIEIIEDAIYKSIRIYNSKEE